MKVLVLGSSGQVASHLKERLSGAEYWGRERVDLANAAPVTEAIVRIRPNFIVNAAAYTAVDNAETEREAAWRMNCQLPAAVARAAAALAVPLLHISTDYVFDGKKIGDYTVHDAPRPLSVYGASKLAGELAVRAIAPESWILRTSWMFSEYGSNFVKAILRLAATERQLRIVADQVGRPTYARDLADAIVTIVRRTHRRAQLPYGLFHAVGGDTRTWYAFAVDIVEAAMRHGLISRPPAILPIATWEYPSAASRPSNSALAPSVELQRVLGASFDWVAGLETTVRSSRAR